MFGLSRFALLEAVFHTFSDAVILGLDPRIERGGEARAALCRLLTHALKTWRKKPSTGCEYYSCCLYVLIFDCVSRSTNRKLG